MQIMPERHNSLLSVPENLSLSFSGKKKGKKPVDQREIEDLLEAGESKSSVSIREEVEAIVRRVLPDEIDSVDEMLVEFRGREGELLTQLRRMEEKSQAAGRVDPDEFISDDDDEPDIEGGDHHEVDMDRWEQDLDRQLTNGSAHTDPRSNPQGGGGGAQLKSPPELLIEEANMAEEKKYESSPELELGHDEDEDENDVPPYVMPAMVKTDSKGHLKVSGLTTQGSLDGSELEMSSSGHHLPSAKKTVALVKLKVWDPANPRGRLKCLATTHIILPNKDELDSEGHVTNARRAALKREGSGGSSKSKRKKRLSLIKEEPERPLDRGDSYYDERWASARNVAADAAKETGEADEAADEGTGTGTGDSSGEIRSELQVGAMVGLQLKLSTSSSSKQPYGMNTSVASSVNSNFSNKRSYEWKVGNAINIHNVNVLPLTNLSELHYRIENNYSSLRHLVFDGWPQSSMALEEAELIFEALGTNTSIRRLSMRYSRVGDDIASLFALALVDNTTLTQLSLEGNEMTNVSAKNFYSVLKKNNETLRMLDLGSNPMIDEDVLLALDQFMEQRALKRTLTNKAEKAKRAARGMPPDAALDDDDDEVEEQVTLVCPQSVIDGILEEVEENDPIQDSPTQLDDSTRVKPLPGESFRDYMLRMDQMKETSNQSPSYHKKLMNESITEAQAFENFRNSGGSSSGRHSPYQYLQVPEPESPTLPQNPTVSTANRSTGSSITTRSTTKRGPDNDIITTTSHDQRSSAEQKAVAWADRARAAPESIESPATEDSDATGVARGHPSPEQRRASLETQESDDGAHPRGDRRPTMTSIRTGASTRTEASGSGPHPYHDTRVSKGSNPSLEISQEDYRDDKADERALRRQLATSAGAVGAYHIEEVAPARQSRGERGRRARVGRSDSQRRARLAELTGGTSGTPNASSAGGTSGADGAPGGAHEEVLDAAIELVDEDMYRQTRRKKSRLSVIGLGDEDAGRTEKITCAILLLCLIGLVVMVIILVT